MSQKNIELQLQALELIEKKYGKTPESYVPNDDKPIIPQSPKKILKTPVIEETVMEEVSKTFPEPSSSTTIAEEFIQQEKNALENTLKQIGFNKHCFRYHHF